MIHGTGRFKGPHEIVVETDDGHRGDRRPTSWSSATGSRPRVPDFVTVDGERVLTTRDAYPPPEIPEHAIVIGSGVTGVEFTHMFDSLGSKVTLLVSRQQVLPIKDAEVAAVLEDAFLAARRHAAEGRARRARSSATATSCACAATTVASSRARTWCSRSARSPTARTSGSTSPASRSTTRGYVPVNHNCLSNVAAHLRRRRRVGQAAAVVGGGDAGPQDRRAPHGPAQPPPPPPRLRQGGVGDLHRPRDRRRRAGRGRGVLRGPQDPGHQGAVLGERQGADQGRRRAAS